MSSEPHTLQIILFVILFLVDMYLLAILFSSVDEQRYRKFILLGPFAFLVPGVLSRRGFKALGGIALVTAAILLLGIDLFEIRELP
jgi:hypothetical protein